jgi:acetyltransferase-like isoleucine patch superfamily enzyme
MSAMSPVSTTTGLVRWFQSRRGTARTRPATVLGKVWVHGRGHLVVGDDVVLDARSAPIEIHSTTGAEITIGRGVRIGSGASLEAISRITIGPGATLGAFCKIMDNHFHPLDGDHRLPRSRPVVVGAGAVVGERAILLPGASVESGAVVPPGTVVSRRFGTAPASATRSKNGDPAGMESMPVGEDRSIAPARSFVGKLRAAADILRATWYLRACTLGRHVHASGPVAVVNEGRITIGANAVLLGGMIPTGLVCARGGALAIGAGTIFNYGVSVTVSRSVTIGDRCQLGSFVRIADRNGKKAGPIVIGADVWIAHGATIEPGVNIGAGSVISAGTTVTGDVPPDTLAIGSPMRCMSLSLRSDRNDGRAVAERP